MSLLMNKYTYKIISVLYINMCMDIYVDIYMCVYLTTIKEK